MMSRAYILKFDDTIVGVFKSKEGARAYLNKYFYIEDEFYHTDNFIDFKVQHKEEESFKGYISLMSYEVLD